MPHPKELYYSETGSRVRYTSKPSSRIDLKRAMSGRSDCFISGISSRKQMQKKLIFADWSIRNCHYEEQPLILDRLKKLMADGFSIYLWQAGEVVPLTDVNCLNERDVRQKITPEFPEKIIKAAVTQQKLTSTNTFLLDTDWFEWLSHWDTLSKPGSLRNLKEDDLGGLSDIEIELVLDILKKTNLVIDTLIYGRLSTETINKPNDKQNILVKVIAQSKDTAYETIKLDGYEIAATVSKHSEQYLKNNTIRLIVTGLDVTKLLPILGLDNFSFFESIIFSECSMITNCFSVLKIGSHSKLKSLRLKKCLDSPTADDWAALSLAAPNIESLHLYESNIAAGFTSLKEGSLPKLKKFELKFGTITPDDWATLSLAAPNLEIINLRATKIAGCFSSLEKGCFVKLNRADLCASNLTSQDLSAFLLAAPNLKTIDLSSCTQISGGLSLLEKGNLPKLIDASLSSSLTSRDLLAFSLAAPNLETLHLSFCMQISAVFPSLETGSLPKLRKINLHNSNVTFKDLSALRNAAPNLEIINATDCKQLTGDFSTLEKGGLIIITARRSHTPSKDELAAAAKSRSALVKPPSIGTFYGSNPVQKFGANTQSATQKLDANTKEDPNKILRANCIFCSTDGKPIPVRDYRLSVFNKLSVNKNPCSLEDAFEMSLEGDLDLVTCVGKRSLVDVFDLGKDIKETDGYSYAYGLHTFELDEEWQAIPSLKASEELLHYHSNPSNAAIEIQYSKNHNRYYIRSLGPKQTISLDFLLKVPTPAVTLPDEIQRLVHLFNSFTPGELKLDPNKTQSTGEDYRRYISIQMKGACRHRAFVFGYKLQREYPQIPVRVVTNDTHAFVEVMVNNQWVNCELGGYAAKVEINDMIRPKPEKQADIPLSGTHYDTQLQPWRDEKPPIESLKTYLQTLVQPSEKKNRLIKLDSEASVTSLVGSLQKHCQDTSRPVFYIHSPEEASGLSHYIERKGNTGTITKGSGNPFAAFLTADYPAGISPIVIVNYSRFNADDIVRLNTMLDKKRSVENFKIPDSFILVGVNNTSDPDCYEGSDFYSRFDTKDSNPVSKTALTEVLSEFPERFSEDAPDNAINLFHASDWKFRLLGGWVLGEGNLVFKEGLLQSALNKGKKLTIKNGLWENPEFVFFWQQACLTGHILGEGGTVFDTRYLKIDTLEGYNWNWLKQGWRINPNFEGEELILNPETLNDYFDGYKITADKRAKPSKGFIQKAARKGQEVLNIYVSHNLSDDEWAMLLSECQDKKLCLSLRCAPGVNLPGEPMNDLKSQVVEWKTSIQDHTQFIQSSDIDTTVALLTKAKQEQKWEVIDISECTPSDLLIHTKPEFKEHHFEFTKTERALLVALKAGKSVILKGNFSEELSAALTPLLLARLKEKEIKGELILISNIRENFEFLPHLYTHEVSVAEKQTLVKSDNSLINWFKPLSTINAELQFPGSSKGLLNLENSIDPLTVFNPETSAQDTLQFNQQRKNLLWSVLDQSLYVYIAGLTGVGKSTFIKNEFLKEMPHKLFRGEQDMEEWARDKSDQLKMLFIDEANLSAKQWSEFEGLFNIPPTILINGELIPLTPQHKVIFAGNPLSYGDERELAPFFTRHQRVVIFDPLPLAVIYEQILKPVFSNDTYANQTPEVCQPMLDVYAFLHGLSTQDVLISPRELQMMALLTASYCEKTPEAIPKEVAKHYAYQLAKNLVPENEKTAFNHQFKPSPIKPLPLPKPARGNDFTITHSRLPAANCLNELLELRQIRRAQAINDQQKYGGLGGVIFEGEPGVGKSEIVTAMLRAHGYSKIKADAPKLEKGFYRMKASLSLAEKEDLLIKAFYAGDIVIIDEINSSPMMESLLNDLLNGQEPTSNSPEKPKDPTTKPIPGFMVIGTQNPITMAGRRKISSPLLKRLQSLEIPPYLPAEMIEILLTDLPKTEMTLKQELIYVVDAYTRNLALAEREHYNPLPTFRDVMRLAKGIKAHPPKEEVQIAAVESPEEPVTLTQDKEEQIITIEPAVEPEIRKHDQTDIEVNLLKAEVQITTIEPPDKPEIHNQYQPVKLLSETTQLSRDLGFFPPKNLKNDSWYYPDAIAVCGFSMAIVAGTASLTLIALGPIGLGILGAAAVLTFAIALTAAMTTALLLGCTGLGLIAYSDNKEDLLTTSIKNYG